MAALIGECVSLFASDLITELGLYTNPEWHDIALLIITGIVIFVFSID